MPTDKLCKSQLLLFVLHKPCFNREYGCSTACLSNYNNCWVNFLKSLPELQATQFRQTVQLHAELLREKFKSSSSFVFNTQSIKKIFLLLKKPKKPHNKWRCSAVLRQDSNGNIVSIFEVSIQSNIQSDYYLFRTWPNFYNKSPHGIWK